MKTHLKRLRDTLEDWGEFTARPLGVIDYSPSTALGNMQGQEAPRKKFVGIKSIKLDSQGNIKDKAKYRRYISQNHGNRETRPYKKANIPNYWKHSYFGKITRAVRELPTNERVIIDMTFIEGKQIVGIAKTLDMSEIGIKQAKRRAYERIYDLMHGSTCNGPRLDR